VNINQGFREKTKEFFFGTILEVGQKDHGYHLRKSKSLRLLVDRDLGKLMNND
jgi:hypothetical protein